MKNIKYILILTLFFLVSSSEVLFAQTKPKISVQGYVLDNTDALIPKVSIVVTNLRTGEKILTETDNNGKYSINLKSGKYSIDARKSGFCPQTRAPFILKKESLGRMNLYMSICSIVSEVILEDDKKSGIKSTYEFPYKQKNLPFQKQQSRVNDILIQYFKHTNLDKTTTYYGRNKAPVLFSHNFLLVKSNSITFKGNNVFTAKGNVVFENKNSVKVYEYVTFLLLEDDYIVLCSKQENISSSEDNQSI